MQRLRAGHFRTERLARNGSADTSARKHCLWRGNSRWRWKVMRRDDTPHGSLSMCQPDRPRELRLLPHWRELDQAAPPTAFRLERVLQGLGSHLSFLSPKNKALLCFWPNVVSLGSQHPPPCRKTVVGARQRVGNLINFKNVLLILIWNANINVASHCRL